MKVSVAIPVYNGEEFLEEVLDAVFAQRFDGELEVLVIDSGSSDRSVEIARASGARVIEIPNGEFGHGRTRNFAMQETSGELVCFLTQDATPASDQWIAAYAEAFSLDPDVGAAFGPHLPRPGVNPLMARLLTEMFHDLSPSGEPVVHKGEGALGFLSNSNSCVARRAWEQIPFRDVAYSEDQALGLELIESGWAKVYAPGAAALHSHDYGLFESFRRYFDEYRGLRDSVGFIEPAHPLTALKKVGSAFVRDARWLAREQDRPLSSKAYWTGVSAVHHTGRVVFGALGARSDRIAPQLRRVMSLEQRSDGVLRRMQPALASPPFGDVWDYESKGEEPLIAPRALDPFKEKLEISWVVPPFSIGSGGHTTIFRMIQELERRGHICSIYVHDPHHLEPYTGAALKKRINEHYMPLEADVHLGLQNFLGADVAIATGWQTAHPVMRLPNCRARAYFVQDHEPEFYPTGSESIFAEHSYRLGMPCIAASPWLAQLLRDRYGAEAVGFELGVNSEEYWPLGFPRRSDMVVFYARNFTPRRAVEIGIQALTKVVEERPNLRVVMYGTEHQLGTSFPYEHLGVVAPDRLRRLYSEATVGISLSLTNYSLIPCEMMACGLPVVELAGRACESVFGEDGSVIELASDHPADVARSVLKLLDDADRRSQLSEAGLAFVRSRTWTRAADIVEDAIVDTYKRRLPEAKPLANDPVAWEAGSLI